MGIIEQLVTVKVSFRTLIIMVMAIIILIFTCNVFQMPDLIMHSQKMIIHQLLFNYHLPSNKVINGLAEILGVNESNQKEAIVSITTFYRL